jgi:DNA-binding HxlR family transcriptional regulator
MTNPLEGLREETATVAAVAAACETLGDRWSLPVVAALLDGPLRYGELRERLPAIAPNILATRLRTLEERGIIVASRYSARPPRFEYRLTGDGAALAGAVELLAMWAARRAGTADAAVHAACGTELELRLWCPACEEVATPAGEETILA